MNVRTLYLFDVDDTLVEAWGTRLLPGREEWFEKFDWDQDACALVSNQGGVGLRHWMEQGEFGEPEKYPRYENVRTRLLRIAEKLDFDPGRSAIFISLAYKSKKGKWGPAPKFGEFSEITNQAGQVPVFASWHRLWRKPGPLMLQVAIQHFGINILSSENIPVAMVGDRAEDADAASKVGAKFYYARDLDWTEA